MAVVATLSKGYDLDYIWKQVDCGSAKDAASYYIQASESGGEPPGRWGPGARALGFERGQTREVTITSADLTGLMDQLDDLLPSGQGMPGQQPT